MFQNFLNSLSLDNKIEVVSIVLSFFTSIIAIIISMKTLKQNSKMIAESTRPYVVIYSTITYFQELQLYLVLKNFGQTGATITKIECDFDLTSLSYNEKAAFINFEGNFIAPGQSFLLPLDMNKLFKHNKLNTKQPITFEISYKSEDNFYSDSFLIRLDAESTLSKVRAMSEENETNLKIIAYTLQDLVEKKL